MDRDRLVRRFWRTTVLVFVGLGLLLASSKIVALDGPVWTQVTAAILSGFAWAILAGSGLALLLFADALARAAKRAHSAEPTHKRAEDLDTATLTAARLLLGGVVVAIFGALSVGTFFLIEDNLLDRSGVLLGMPYTFTSMPLLVAWCCLCLSVLIAFAGPWLLSRWAPVSESRFRQAGVVLLVAALLGIGIGLAELSHSARLTSHATPAVNSEGVISANSAQAEP